MIQHRLKTLMVVVLSLSFSGCHKTYDTGIYRTGREWNFIAYFFNAQDQLTDSCTLQLAIGKGGLLSTITGQRELKYTYGNCCGRKELQETTGVDERANFVFIHPPRLSCFAFTEISPMPSVSLPVDMNSSSTTELEIVKGFKDLNGKTIKQKHRPVKMDSFSFAGTSIECVVVQGENTNYIKEIGVYKSEHLFNTSFGFVQMNYYKPTGESVKIILKSTNFK